MGEREPYTYAIKMFRNEEVEKWREFFSRKRLIINKEVAHKRVIKCTNLT
jgi:fructosamine-3-kinase